MLDGVGYANYSNAARVAAGESPRYRVEGDNVFSFLTNPDGTPSDVIDNTPNELYDWQDYIYEQALALIWELHFLVHQIMVTITFLLDLTT